MNQRDYEVGRYCGQFTWFVMQFGVDGDYLRDANGKRREFDSEHEVAAAALEANHARISREFA